jgi:adenosylcobinamide kinase/adenosylcobinamide-phosphate guanylyltransferase
VITLVLGGARSGKSEVAERLAARWAERTGRPVVYVATAQVSGDADFAARVAAHRARRPAGWVTVEAGADLVGALGCVSDPAAIVLVDSLGTWVAATPNFAVDVAELSAVLCTRRPGSAIVVSDEVGLGVHPVSEAGRRFRDVLGQLNQQVAEVADEVWLVVAGRVLRLGAPFNLPLEASV